MWSQRQPDYGDGRENPPPKHFSQSSVQPPYNSQVANDYPNANTTVSNAGQAPYGAYPSQQPSHQPHLQYPPSYPVHQQQPQASTNDPFQSLTHWLQQQQPVGSVLPQQQSAQSLLFALIRQQQLQQQQQQQLPPSNIKYPPTYHDSRGISPSDNFMRSRDGSFLEQQHPSQQPNDNRGHWNDVCNVPSQSLDRVLLSQHHTSDPRNSGGSTRNYQMSRPIHDMHLSRDHANVRDDYMGGQLERDGRGSGGTIRGRREDNRGNNPQSGGAGSTAAGSTAGRNDRSNLGSSSHRRGNQNQSSQQQQQLSIPMSNSQTIPPQRTPVTYPWPMQGRHSPQKDIINNLPHVNDTMSTNSSIPLAAPMAINPNVSNPNASGATPLVPTSKPIASRKYIAKISSHVTTTPFWEYSEMKKRFSQMFLSSFVSRIILSWTLRPAIIPLDIKVPVSITNFPEEKEDEMNQIPHYVSTLTPRSEPLPVAENQIQYWVKIMLMSGVPFDQQFDAIVSPQNYEIPPNHLNKDDSITHFAQHLKFLVLRRQRNKLCAFGGLYDPALDGPNPEEEQTLVNTAIRLSKAELHLDLSGCSQWIRFMEVHYSRVDASINDVSIYLIPSVWDILPDLETTITNWQEENMFKFRMNQEKAIGELMQKKQELEHQYEESSQSSSSSTSVHSADSTTTEGPLPSSPKSSQMVSGEVETNYPSSPPSEGSSLLTNPSESMTTPFGLLAQAPTEQPLQEPVSSTAELQGGSSYIGGESIDLSSFPLPGQQPQESLVDSKNAIVMPTLPSNPLGDALAKQISALQTAIAEKQAELSNFPIDKLNKEPPGEPQLFAMVRSMRSNDCKFAAISLDGLMDYSFEYDREEDVMELSLFAESFWNYIQHCFGLQVYQALANSLKRSNEKIGADPSSSPASVNSNERTRYKRCSREEELASSGTGCSNHTNLLNKRMRYTGANRNTTPALANAAGSNAKPVDMPSNQPCLDDQVQSPVIKEYLFSQQASTSIPSNDPSLVTNSSSLSLSVVANDEPISGPNSHIITALDPISNHEQDSSLALAVDMIVPNDVPIDNHTKPSVSLPLPPLIENHVFSEMQVPTDDATINMDIQPTLEATTELSMHAVDEDAKISIQDAAPSNTAPVVVNSSDESLTSNFHKDEKPFVIPTPLSSSVLPLAPCKEITLDLLRAFHFFDRNRTGYLRAEDLEHLLYSLSIGLSRHYVTDLILKADSNSVSQRFERKRKIYYGRFVDNATSESVSSSNPSGAH